MKSPPKSQKSFSVRTTYGHRQLQSLRARQHLQTMRITELEERLSFLVAVLQVALVHSDYKSTTSHEDAPQTLH